MKLFRIASVVLILMILTVCTVPSAFSAEKGTVYSEIITSVQKEEKISIPIKIKNAKDLMGVKLSFTPSGDELKITSVESGELTQNGFFNHNADINEHTFDVVWSGTEGIGEDGVLCVINLECIENFESFSFEVTYSQADTFDEDFNDVELVCEEIIVEGVKEEKNDYSLVIDEIVDDKKSVIESIELVLEKFNCETPEDVKSENLEEFITEISAVVDGFSDATKNLSGDEKLDVVKEIYSDNKQPNTTVSNETSEKDTADLKSPNENSYWIVISIGLAVLIVLAVALLMVRRKKDEKSNS